MGTAAPMTNASSVCVTAFIARNGFDIDDDIRLKIVVLHSDQQVRSARKHKGIGVCVSQQRSRVLNCVWSFVAHWRFPSPRLHSYGHVCLLISSISRKLVSSQALVNNVWQPSMDRKCKPSKDKPPQSTLSQPEIHHFPEPHMTSNQVRVAGKGCLGSAKITLCVLFRTRVLTEGS